MKTRKILIVNFIVVVCNCFALLASNMSENLDSTLNNRQYKHSALAEELIEYYTPRWTGNMVDRPQILPVAPLNPEHVSEKYRSAWEEILIAGFSKPSDPRIVSRIVARTLDALREIKNPHTIKALEKAFDQTVRDDVSQQRMVDWQNHLLRTIIHIGNEESLETVFLSLDKLDKRYGKQKPKVSMRGLTLREEIQRSLVQPDLKDGNIYKEKNKKRLDVATKWKERALRYNKRDKLSPKNKELLDNIRDFQRNKSDPNKNKNE